MFGSKNSELTRKYGLISLAASTFALEISSRPVAASTKPTAANSSASPTTTQNTCASSAVRPRHVEQQRQQRGERHVEAADRDARLRDVRRVRRLDRVEHDDDPQRDLHAPQRPRRRSAPAPAAAAGRLAPCAQRERQRARGDHAVQGDEQVRGLAAEAHRHAERQRGERQQRERLRPAVDHDGHDDQADHAGDGRHHDQLPVSRDAVGDRVRLERDDPAHGEHQRGQHGDRAGPRIAQDQHRRGADRRRGEQRRLGVGRYRGHDRHDRRQATRRSTLTAPPVVPQLRVSLRV